MRRGTKGAGFLNDLKEKIAKFLFKHHPVTSRLREIHENAAKERKINNPARLGSRGGVFKKKKHYRRRR